MLVMFFCIVHQSKKKTITKQVRGLPSFRRRKTSCPGPPSPTARDVSFSNGRSGHVLEVNVGPQTFIRRARESFIAAPRIPKRSTARSVSFSKDGVDTCSSSCCWTADSIMEKENSHRSNHGGPITSSHSLRHIVIFRHLTVKMADFQFPLSISSMCWLPFYKNKCWFVTYLPPSPLKIYVCNLIT